MKREFIKDLLDFEKNGQKGRQERILEPDQDQLLFECKRPFVL